MPHNTTQNIHNLKSGDKFRTTTFCGNMVVSHITSDSIKFIMEHVSGTDVRSSMPFSVFNNKMVLGEIQSLVRC